MSNDSKTVADFLARVELDVEIQASPEVVFESILEEMTGIPDGKGKSMNLKLEAFPGGRWYRDLGNNTGHLWGHVQVIKPPTLIEVYGPMMMSMAVVNHVTYRVTQTGDRCRLVLTHRIFGEFDPKIPNDVKGGWGMVLDRVKAGAEKKR